MEEEGGGGGEGGGERILHLTWWGSEGLRGIGNLGPIYNVHVTEERSDGLREIWGGGGGRGGPYI